VGTMSGNVTVYVERKVKTWNESVDSRRHYVVIVLKLILRNVCCMDVVYPFSGRT
jgi:hypothetical protein